MANALAHLTSRDRGAAGTGGENDNAPHNDSALMRTTSTGTRIGHAQLTPAERLREALELSDFCLKLAAKGRELRAIPSSPQNLKRS